MVVSTHTAASGTIFQEPLAVTLGQGAVVPNIDRHTGVLRPPLVISASLRTTSSSLFKFCLSRRNSTRADLSLGRWRATITCSFSDRRAYSVPSPAPRRAGLPSCASQHKSDGHQLTCGGPLPEHGTTTVNSFASKQRVAPLSVPEGGIALSIIGKWHRMDH